MEEITPYIEQIADAAARAAYIEPYERGNMVCFDWQSPEGGISVYGEVYCCTAGWDTYGDGYETPCGYALVNPDAIIQKLEISGAEPTPQQEQELSRLIRSQMVQALQEL